MYNTVHHCIDNIVLVEPTEWLDWLASPLLTQDSGVLLHGWASMLLNLASHLKKAFVDSTEINPIAAAVTSASQGLVQLFACPKNHRNGGDLCPRWYVLSSLFWLVCSLFQSLRFHSSINLFPVRLLPRSSRTVGTPFSPKRGQARLLVLFRSCPKMPG